jgi:hypothetical protein
MKSTAPPPPRCQDNDDSPPEADEPPERRDDMYPGEQISCKSTSLTFWRCGMFFRSYAFSAASLSGGKVRKRLVQYSPSGRAHRYERRRVEKRASTVPVVIADTGRRCEQATGMRATPGVITAVALLVMSIAACSPARSSQAPLETPTELVGSWVRLREDSTWGDTLTYLADGRVLGSVGHPVPPTAAGAYGAVLASASFAQRMSARAIVGPTALRA